MPGGGRAYTVRPPLFPSLMKISGRPIGAQLRSVVEDPTATHIADVVVGHWRAISDALKPIIGAQGVSSLYRRSLFLTRVHHRWLSDAVAEPPADAFDHLRRILALRTSQDAADAQTDLLQIFSDLLTSLIGIALAERLLGAVWDHPPAGADQGDRTP